MKISQRREGDVLIMELAGRMTIGEGDTQAGEAVRSAVTSGEMKILLDMRDVPVLDSSGVGELVSAYTSASNRGATIKLLKLAPRVGDVLKSTRLTGIFDIYDDEVDALESFA